MAFEVNSVHDHARLAPPLDQRCQLARHAPSRNRSVGNGGKAFSRDVVDDVSANASRLSRDAETAAASELVMGEIQ